MILTTLALSVLAAPQSETPIPVLLVSGANNHDWRWTTPSLARILESSGRFTVDVTYDPANDLTDEARVAKAKAIVLDYNGPSWGDAASAAFLDAVRGGTGVVVVHAADNSGVGWPEYEKLVGDLWRKGTGHGRFHAFDVDVVDRDHPVTRSLPTLLKHPDELYHRLVDPHGVERRVLASAFSSPESGGTGEDEPMIMVGTYGEGRMFHTPLGHVWKGNVPSQASHNDPQFRGLIVRGTEWAATGTVRDERTRPAELTKEERDAGWRSLHERSAWRSFRGGEVPEGWRFDGDMIVREDKAGDIVTNELFGDFELAFQWKATIAGNGGIKYRIPADAKQPIGPEYQVLDSHSDVKRVEHRAGALYDVIDANQDTPRLPWGEWHEGRIVASGTKIEHWLDGVLVASADTSRDTWAAKVADSKFRNVEGFAQPREGRILLQDHGDEVWYRALRVRALGSEGGDSNGEPLFEEGDDLSSWGNVGDAIYAVEGDTLIGRAGPKRRQSFLVSKEAFGDFVLEVDVKIATLGNSGIQLRSHVNEKGRLYGYQAEIDPTDRRWSGGIFDEGRRGWLNPLEGNDAARNAFQMEGWNRYRIECEGPRIRTWVNGVPAADLLDGVDLDGSIGFQIHGGDDDVQIHWRGARVKRDGRHAWLAVDPAKEMSVDGAPGVRMRVAGDDGRLVVRRGNEDGGGQMTVALGEQEGWRDGGKNLVSVLSDGARCVVQIGDRTVGRWEQAPMWVSVGGEGVAVDAAWVCRKE